MTTKLYKGAKDATRLAPKRQKPEVKASVQTEGAAAKKQENTTTKKMSMRKSTQISSTRSSVIPEKTGCAQMQSTYTMEVRGS